MRGRPGKQGSPGPHPSALRKGTEKLSCRPSLWLDPLTPAPCLADFNPILPLSPTDTMALCDALPQPFFYITAY